MCCLAYSLLLPAPNCCFRLLYLPCLPAPLCSWLGTNSLFSSWKSISLYVLVMGCKLSLTVQDYFPMDSGFFTAGTSCPFKLPSVHHSLLFFRFLFRHLSKPEKLHKLLPVPYTKQFILLCFSFLALSAMGMGLLKQKHQNSF